MNSSAELWFLNISFHSICTIVSFANVPKTLQVFKFCIKLEKNPQPKQTPTTTTKKPRRQSLSDTSYFVTL